MNETPNTGKIRLLRHSNEMSRAGWDFMWGSFEADAKHRVTAGSSARSKGE
jgi:hypothetical protein